MRSLFAVILLLQSNLQAISQTAKTVSLSKPPLDTSVLGKWPELHNGALSPDGKYASYVLEEHMPLNQTTTIVQSPDGKWKRELKGIRDIKFSQDSKNAYYLSHDTLCNIELGTQQVYIIEDVQSYKLVPFGKSEWIVYQLKSPRNELVIKEEKTKKENRFSAVENYFFCESGEAVVIESKTESEKENKLTWVDLKERKENRIWIGSAKPLQVIFDDAVSHVCFTTEEGTKRGVWLYNKGRGDAELIISDRDTSIEKGLYIGSLDRFSKDGERLFFSLERRYPMQPLKPDAPNVNVWRYNDIKLQAEQLKEQIGKKAIIQTYLSGIDLKSHHVFRILLDNDDLKVFNRSENYTLVFHLDTDQKIGLGSGEMDWQTAAINGSYYLISNKDGSRKILPLKFIKAPIISPGEKFIVYRPDSMLHYFVYEINSGIIRNITDKIKTDLTKDVSYKNQPIENKFMLSPIGWLKNDSVMMIYDHNDIWLVDPLANSVPENVTNGYGLKHRLIFRLGLGDYSQSTIFHLGDKILLSAFNKSTKYGGHYFIVLGKKNDPKPLSWGKWLYTTNVMIASNGGNMSPMPPSAKSKNAEAYLYKRQTVSDYPNYYYTTDLNHFQQITYLAPEKKYNWMVSELCTWLGPDGDTLQGLLYKPENFDQSKKYPVLFSIYRQFSDQLNSYLEPNWTSDRIDIPYFVSHGYLVFTPDIHYTVPKLKESVVNCVVSAAKYLSTLPFVDASKIGIQGHSFGGLEVGYVVTNANPFSAACSVAGSYDLISDAGSIVPSPYGTWRNNFQYDLIYGTIWQKKELYIINSPIFDADKMKIPFLIVAGEKDYVKPYNQNVEFFLGLRRMLKPTWMLTYPEDDHAIDSRKMDMIDCSIRITQFFDHYLKSAPAPTWMTKGIPARLKGIETGYAYDPSGNCGKDCKVCKMWNENMKKDSAGTCKEIEEKTKSEHWMGGGK